MDELLDKYHRDQTPLALEHLIEHYRPLAASVCRRYLRSTHDVEDATQDALMRLASHAGSVSGSVTAWLTTTAYTCSIDLIRRSTSQQRRREIVARSPLAQHQVLHESIRQRIHEALAAIDPGARELIVARFFRKEPLRMLATAAGVAAGTMSRRVGAALTSLSEVLTDMGVDGTDDLTLAEHFGDLGNVMELGTALRFSPDWNSRDLLPQGVSGPAPALLPGWLRPMRVGVMVSYATLTQYSAPLDDYVPVFDQVRTTGRFTRGGVQLVAIIESGTDRVGVVEATLRDYDLLGGLIRADDAEALSTLDVILLGNNFCMSAPIAKAIWQAVRDGVGLINERWTGSMDGQVSDPHVLDLMLAATPWFSYHHPDGCATLAAAAVRESHPLLPGLEVGSHLMIPACGPAYQPVAGANVALMQQATVSSEWHQIPNLRSLPLPVWLSGTLGQGRVIVVQVWPHDRLTARLSVSAESYFSGLLKWVAEPRRVR